MALLIIGIGGNFNILWFFAQWLDILKYTNEKSFAKWSSFFGLAPR